MSVVSSPMSAGWPRETKTIRKAFSSITTFFVVALSGFGIATPAPNPVVAAELAVPTLANTTESHEAVLGKRAPTGLFRTWASADPAGCVGNPGQTISNPANGRCYTHSSPAQIFRRARWTGSNCRITIYTSSNCNPATVNTEVVSSGFCWSGGWAFLSFKVSDC
ncbi:hypothetical protein QBC44DRAFT_310265 [Cladorrhinum sp. PSN332]|nr:hypothetical protein QBC44DRAFT_310265 [Cladorrhinum sp. PSN332]